MIINMTDKVVIVTGGNKGIGEGIAKGFASEGAKVAIWGRNAADNERVVSDITKAGGVAVSMICDVSNDKDVADATDAVLAAFGGRIDVLVNNAGITKGAALVWNMDPDDWRKTIDVDLTGLFLCTRSVVPTMIKQRYGRIITVASIAGKRLGKQSGIHYTSAKSGAHGFNRHLAIELGAYGITANIVNPGSVATPMTDKLWSEEDRRGRIAAIPVGRLAEPEDVFNACLFFASDQASMVTAQDINVDGGQIYNYYDNPTYHSKMGQPLPDDLIK